MTAEPGRGAGGIVLAAGRSVRMGRPKSLLPAGDRSFLAACVSVLRSGGARPVVAVIGDEASGGQAAVREARAAGAVVVRNLARGSEQIDSLRVGLDALEDEAPPPAAALVLPVDHPLVTAGTVRAILDDWAVHPAAVARPVHDGRPGHPTLFPRPLWPRLREELEAGARSLLESEGVVVRDVSVDDPGVLQDIDTPAGYRSILGGHR